MYIYCIIYYTVYILVLPRTILPCPTYSIYVYIVIFFLNSPAIKGRRESIKIIGYTFCRSIETFIISYLALLCLRRHIDQLS